MKIVGLLFLWFFTCSALEPGQKDLPMHPLSNSGKILIIYLSRTNNTKAIAEIVQQVLGGDLIPLELKHPYPEGYDAIVKQVAEENESGFLPPLKTKVDIDKYDTVFLGFPTWGMQMPPPMKSFLHENDLSDKAVVPFNTNAGYGVGSSFETVEELCPDSAILEGFSMKGGIERDGIYLAIKGTGRKEAEQKVKSWLIKIGVLK